MSLKKLLGLESFPLTETQIAAKIQEAYRERKQEIHFRLGDKDITVRLQDIEPKGITWHGILEPQNL